ncbi:unnamed protein product [Cylicocyclus nassatus]|uniref:SCP domain-containing protein n=1 Tax=Cylicocyclus nassatus TaxID=53992 RepID=A0AA36H125_CYLNA|nr:unnamed protein product [Cylicocyclus nassatus]
MTVKAAIVFAVALIPSIAPAFCPDGKLEESDIEAALAKINEKRSIVVKGNADPLPAGKNMNKIDWSCTLEEEASAFLSNCNGFPADKAYMYWAEDDNTVDEVIDQWYKQGLAADNLESLIDSEKSKVAYNSDSYSATEFANLIRASTTEIGCARASGGDCEDIYVLCFTNQPQLENGDTIYEVGDGACSDGSCDSGSCNTGTGLCEIAAETTTTVAKETATTKPASYPGELPSGTNTQCSSNVGMTDELRMQFLDTQNYRRSILAKGQVPRPSGNYLPTGANIIKLNFSCALEKEAIQEVRQCPTSKTTNGTYGKNFDTFASTTLTSTYRDAVKKAVTNWWKVVRKESNGPGMQVTFRSNHVNQPVETYTQIAWANTRYIGCAIAKCSSSYTVICLYDPKGNIVDQVLYMKGSPCAACPTGTTCDSAIGLCVPRS